MRITLSAIAYQLILIMLFFFLTSSTYASKVSGLVVMTVDISLEQRCFVNAPSNTIIEVTKVIQAILQAFHNSRRWYDNSSNSLISPALFVWPLFRSEVTILDKARTLFHLAPTFFYGFFVNWCLYSILLSDLLWYSAVYNRKLARLPLRSADFT